MSYSFTRKPFKVEFLDGTCSGAVRYYSSLRAARAASRRYVSNRINGRSLFTHPCCEIFFVSPFGPKFLEVVL